MTLSREDTAKLLIRRANLMDWIAEARSELNQIEFNRSTIGYRLRLEAVEEELRRGGVWRPSHLALMSGYEDVDGVIAEWVKMTDSELFTEWADAPVRCFHIAGDPPFECFQVNVQLPENGRTSVTGRAIDTNDDTEAEMDQTWEGPVGELDEMLRTAVATIETWKARKRQRPDPASPW